MNDFFWPGVTCTKADTKVNNNCFTEFDDPLQFVLSAPHLDILRETSTQDNACSEC